MKSVKSTDDLKRLALARGASASVGGVKFNSTGDKVKAEPKPEPKPEPKAEPEVRPDPMALQTEALMHSNTQLMGEMTKALEKLAPVDPPKKWKLTVQRDTRGVLQSIEVEQQR